MKVFKNFLILSEFLVLGFLRFMKLSNIMERSYLEGMVVFWSLCSNPLKWVLCLMSFYVLRL